MNHHLVVCQQIRTLMFTSEIMTVEQTALSRLEPAPCLTNPGKSILSFYLEWRYMFDLGVEGCVP